MNGTGKKYTKVTLGSGRQMPTILSHVLTYSQVLSLVCLTGVPVEARKAEGPWQHRPGAAGREVKIEQWGEKNSLPGTLK